MTPPLAPLAEEIYADLGPLPEPDEENGWALALLVNAVLQQYAGLDEASRATDEDPGWSALMDLDRTPDEALPWLAQFVGARLPFRSTPEEQRQYILDRPGWRRGRVDTLTNVVKAFLTGTKSVRLFERDTSPYHFTFRVYASQIGAGTYRQTKQAYATYALRSAAKPTYGDAIATNSALIEDAIRAAKPAGLQFDLEVFLGPTYDDITTEAATYADRTAEFRTYADVFDFVP